MKNLSNLIAAINVNDLVPRPGETNADLAHKYSEIEQVTKLPELTEAQLATDIIRIILEISGSLALIGIVIAGIYMLQAQGDEERISKGKQILLNLVIGALIIGSAYAIVIGISQFNFFSN